uniref:Uncharacterized protein n=1 Tax=Siphoviridae sp. ctvok7 TaxID=2827596 RepID=A0A8S5LLQ7_9CAUD|nr:MAG TPA: hypothetical protein [Siphoviridae sp. ctvok7]
MGLNPQIIGKEMPHGFAGCYARQPDMIVETRPAGGEAAIPFGTPLVYDAAKPAVVAAGAGFTAAAFAGVAGFEIKSALTYLDQQAGQYAPGEAVSVFQRGSINVKCTGGTPALGGAVYVLAAKSAQGDLANAAVGDFVASADSTTAANTVQLTNCQWGGPADANGIAELVILTKLNA